MLIFLPMLWNSPLSDMTLANVFSQWLVLHPHDSFFQTETWTLAKTSINSFFHRFSLVYLKSHLQAQGHLDFSPELCSQRFLITFLLGRALIDPNLASNLYVAKMTLYCQFSSLYLLGFQACGTMLGLWGTGDRSQGFLHGGMHSADGATFLASF